MTRFKPLLLLSSVWLLSSCATLAPQPPAQTPSVATEAPDQVAKVCTVIKPVYYSRHDTPQTVTQVQQLNAAVVALCPQYAPKKTK